MKLKTFLLVAAVILAIIFLSGKTILYYYWAALVVTVSYLNSRTAFLQEPYKVFNALFILYFLFIVWERTRNYQFSTAVELQINNLEHILYSMVVCLMAGLVLKLPPFTLRSFYVRLLLTILIFNSIGFITEWFQNGMYGRPLFTLIPDSIKDLRMNLWGTLIFIFLSLIAYYFDSKRKQSLRPEANN